METPKTIKIFVVNHLDTEKPLPLNYFYIGVSGSKNHFFNDNTGDNISFKNPFYCELTAQYYIWKNINCNIVGLVHYRRFFYHPFKSFRRIKKYTTDEFEKILRKYDVILPKAIKLYKKGKARTVKEQMKGNEDPIEFKIVREILNSYYKDYLPAFDFVMKSKKMYFYNIIVSSKLIFDSYSSFLFDVLEKTENIYKDRKIEIEKRLFGYISERLIYVFVLKNKFKIKELPIINESEPLFKQNLKYLLGPLSNFYSRLHSLIK